MLTLNIDYFKSKPVNIRKITILLDHGYSIDVLTQALEQVYPEIMTKIRFELSTKRFKRERYGLKQDGLRSDLEGSCSEHEAWGSEHEVVF